MKEFMFNYGWIILLLVVGGVYLFWYFKKYGKDMALNKYREIAYTFMIFAEKRFGDGEGRLKFIWVVERFYPILPDTLKFFISRNAAERWLQYVYDEIKDFLDDGQLNDSNVKLLGQER